MVAPLLQPDGIAYPHQHEHSTVIVIILLWVILPNSKFEFSLVKKFCEFEGVFEDWIIVVVVFRVLHTIKDYDLYPLEDGKIPVISIIDRHYKHIVWCQIFLFQKPLDLILCFGNGISSEV